MPSIFAYTRPFSRPAASRTIRGSAGIVKKQAKMADHGNKCYVSGCAGDVLWNSQSDQSWTLLFRTLPNKPITDHLILGRNPRVVNGHVKSFMDHFCPYLSHIPSMQISENRLKYCINAFYGTFKAAVCKFCLFVAISVWKPEIAAAAELSSFSPYISIWTSNKSATLFWLTNRSTNGDLT